MKLQILKDFDRQAFDRRALLALFAGMEEHLAVQAVVFGQAAGWVAVDDPQAPQVALLRAGHRLHLGGNPLAPGAADALQCFLAGQALAPAASGGEDSFGLYFAPAWQPHLGQILPEHPLAPARRQYFALQMSSAPAADGRARLPQGFSLCAVNAELLLRRDLQRLDWLEEEMLSERESTADFLARSFGVCLLKDESEIAGWCLSEYNCDDACEVGIATHDAYQKRGLATGMMLAFLEQAWDRGIRRIGWHCYARNLSSAATARKAGLDWVKDYEMGLVMYDLALHRAVQGDVCFWAEQYDEAQGWFEQALQRWGYFAPGWACWGAACSAAMNAQPQVALAYLRRAMANGMDDLPRIRSSRYLQSLHALPEWQALVAD